MFNKKKNKKLNNIKLAISALSAIGSIVSGVAILIKKNKKVVKVDAKVEVNDKTETEKPEAETKATDVYPDATK